ncbi:HIT domain-containing protein [Kaistia geumhonensis]|uniref:Diadenosine tetraphosphate (Ap4A) HIT family hydrolase n=1 Tax=Kaistia geumhonensis TaxID=410839 RepID=A0ABU0MCJ7_9HYPH|nr:HIT domain-containing protein [Kaistia geumhonensis]MCX5481609.1 HIT domain-containing protein [Kaistia geumhonensis]MDQ0518676.1 diadenosine tetraphosphate (Ap4A) HIT family hydrolase [Kaistia geumhonensis]
MPEFAVDPRILADSVAVGDLALCHVRLMDDARFPWLLLLPRRVGLTELTELAAPDVAMAMEEVRLAADALRAELPFAKLNIAAIGNVVSQLHIHVIGRSPDDVAWPDPVWTYRPRTPRDAGESARIAGLLRRRIIGAT